MKIGFGRFKGREINVPPGLSVRPATAQVREYLANILADHFPGAVVLDLFSGSGALGLQALSLGARFVEFVEMGHQALPVLLQNIQKLEVSSLVRVRRRDVLRHLKHEPEKAFDLILIDPPYKMLDFQPLLDDIEKNNWLNPGGILFIEHPRKMQLAGNKLQLWKEKQFGNSVVKIFQYHLSPL